MKFKDVFAMAVSMISISCSNPSQDRSIPFAGIENARELGGLAMQDGRTVRHWLLVRSGNLSKATDEDVAIIREQFKLGDVFDFRFDAEAGADPDRRIEGVTYTRLSTLPQKFIDGFSSGRADTAQVKSADFVEALARYSFMPQVQQMAKAMYPAIVTDSTSQRLYGEFLRGVLKAPGGVLWHCSQGKDRAGWASAFVLAALGASRETIVEDFDLSNKYYAPQVEKLSAKVDSLGGGEAEKAVIRAMVGVSRENFENALDLIDSMYGSMDNYLQAALGFTMEEITILRDKYLI